MVNERFNIGSSFFLKDPDIQITRVADADKKRIYLKDDDE